MSAKLIAKIATVSCQRFSEPSWEKEINPAPCSMKATLSVSMPQVTKESHVSMDEQESDLTREAMKSIEI